MAPIKISKKSLVTGIAILIASAIGILLIISAVLKGMDLLLFLRQIREYGIVSHPLLLLPIAWGIIWLEWILGFGLLMRYRPRLVAPMVILLFVLFIGATAFAWVKGIAEDCGCFGGWLERSPKEAFVEDIIILVLLLFAWLFLPNQKMDRIKKVRNWIFIFIVLTGLFVPLLRGVSVPRSFLTRGEHPGEELTLSQIEGLKSVNLKTGTHLIVLMDIGCHHCIESLDDMNDLAEDGEVPGLIALCINEVEEILKFNEEFGPLFSLENIQEQDFWYLLGDGDIPYTLLVKNGRLLRKWNQTIPEKAEIHTALFN